MRREGLVAAGLCGVIVCSRSVSAQAEVGAPEESKPSREAPPAPEQAPDVTAQPLDSPPAAVAAQPPREASAPAEEEGWAEPVPRRRLAWEALQAEQKARESGVYDEEPEEERPRRRAVGMFSKGDFWPSLHVGRARAFEQTYLILGAGFGYFVIDGLAPALVYDVWLLGDPIVHRVTEELTYVFHMVPYVKPYAGAFVRQYLILELEDRDSVGLRGGLIVPIEPAYFGVGLGYEAFLDCSYRYRDCDSVYPEFLAGAAF